MSNLFAHLVPGGAVSTHGSGATSMHGGRALAENDAAGHEVCEVVGHENERLDAHDGSPGGYGPCEAAVACAIAEVFRVGPARFIL